MLAWGTRATRRRIGTGTFDCPTCRRNQPYLHMRAQRHGHLYAVPLLPIGPAIEYLECQGCHGTFGGRTLEVARNPQAGVGAAHEPAMLRVMVAAALAEGALDRRERDRIMDVFEALTGRTLTVVELEEAIREHEEGEGDVGSFLAALAPRLEEDGKERVLHAALFVAASDGLLDDRGSRRVRAVAKRLGMSGGRMKRAVAQLAN